MVEQYKKELQQVKQTNIDQEKILIETEEYLENIFYQSNMMITLINDLLDLAKLETLNFSFNDKYFSLNDLVDKAYDTIKYQAQEKKIKVIKEYQMRITDRHCKFYKVETTYEERREFFN